MSSIIAFILGFCLGFAVLLIGIIVSGVDHDDNE